MARLDEAHARSPAGIVTAPFLTRKTRDSPLRVGDGILDYELFEGAAEVLWIWRIGGGRSRDNGQAHRVTITRSHDTRPVTRLASLLDNRFEGHLRYGSVADIRGCVTDVCFPAKSGHAPAR
jgi:hypothetical protein